MDENIKSLLRSKWDEIHVPGFVRPNQATLELISDQIFEITLSFTEEEHRQYELALRQQHHINKQLSALQNQESQLRLDVSILFDRERQAILEAHEHALATIHQLEALRTTESQTRDRSLSEHIATIAEITKQAIFNIEDLARTAILTEEHDAITRMQLDAAQTREAIARQEAELLRRQAGGTTVLRQTTTRAHSPERPNTEIQDAINSRTHVETNAHKQTTTPTNTVDPATLSIAERRRLFQERDAAAKAEEAAKKTFRKPGR